MIIAIILIVLIALFLFAFDFAASVIFEQFNITLDPIIDIIVYLILAAVLLVLPFVLLKISAIDRKINTKKGLFCIITWAIEIIAVSAWLLFPVTPSFMASEEAYSMSIVKYINYETKNEKIISDVTTTDLGLVEKLLNSLEGQSYNHATKRDMKADNDSYVWKINIKNEWGETVQYICIYSPKDITVVMEENTKYANFTKKYDYEKIQTIVNDINGDLLSDAAAETYGLWSDFANDMLGSVTVDHDNHSWSFTIPESFPADDYEIKVSMTGKVDYQGGEFVPHKLTCLKDQHENQSWEAGKTYTVRFDKAVLQHAWITLKIDGYVFTRDIIDLMPEENRY